MNLAKIVRPFFSTLIVAVEVDNKNCLITVQYFKKDKAKKTLTKEFKTIPGEIPAQAVRFLKRISAQNPFTYIVVLVDSIMQGAVNTDKDEEFGKFGVNSNEVLKIKFERGFSVYVAKSAIAEIKRKFLNTGVDFIISPFALLYNLTKDRFQDSCKLYVLFRRSNITMIITKPNEGVLYASFYTLDSDIDSKLKMMTHSLSEDVDAIDSLDVTLDIQKELSSIDDIGLEHDSEDSELLDDLKEDNLGEDSLDLEEKKHDFDDYSKVSTAVQYMQSSLNEFYSNEIYKSEFVNDIVIFNPHNISEESLAYVHNTMLLDVEIVPCDLLKELIKIGYESYSFFHNHKRRA